MTGPAFDHAIAELEKRGHRVKRHGNYAQTWCTHDGADNPTGLSIFDTGNRIQFTCFTRGCTGDEVRESLGLAVRDMFHYPREGPYGIGEAIAYRAPDGRTNWRSTRGKDFRTDNRGASTPDDRKLPYLSDRLGDAADVYVVESPNDAEAISAVGGVAVSTFGSKGASKYDWSAMKGRQVSIVVHPDEAGEGFAQEVARLLSGVASSVTLLRAATGKDAADHLAAGHGLDDLQPFEETILGACLLEEVRAAISRFVVLPSSDALVAVTLWVAATHAGQWFEHATRLAVHSPEKRCGKSRLLEVVEALVHDPVPTSNASVAALFRLIGAAEGNPPTLVIDEADRLFGTRKADDDNRDLIGLLNNGFRPGKPTWRCVGPQQVATAFPNFAFAALAGIGRLPDTIEDRAVNLTMRRRLPGESVERFRLRTDRPDLATLGVRLGAWVAGVGQRLADPVTDLPGELEDRAQDAWEPLIAVADAAGGDWPTLARRAAVALAQEQAEDDAERSTRLRILADVRTVFAADGGDFISTASLLDSLRDMEEAPWKDFDLTARKLARYLAEFKVKPSRNKAQTARGYHLNDLSDPFDRYLLAEVVSVPSIPAETGSDKGLHLDSRNRLDGTTRLPETDRLPESPSQPTVQTDRRDRQQTPRNCAACGTEMVDLGDQATTHPTCQEASR